MIRIIENDAYPYYGTSWSAIWNSYARKFFIAFHPDVLSTSVLEPGYLSQGKHEHYTGWSSVKHAKAQGSCMRVDDGTFVGFGPKTPSELKSLPAKSIYITNGLNAKGNPSSAYPSILTCGLDQYTYCVYIQSNDPSGRAVISFIVVKWVHRPGYSDDYVYPLLACEQSDWSNVTEKWVGNTVGTSKNVYTRGFPHNPKTGQLDYDIMTTLLNMKSDIDANADFTRNALKVKSNYSTPYYVPATASGFVRSDEYITTNIRREFRRLYQDAHDYQASEIMALQATSFDSINRFDGNMLALATDFRKVGRSSVDIFTNILESRKNPRKLASAWLSARYGDRLTYSDLKELLHGFSVSPWRSRRFSKFILGRGRRSGSSPDQLTSFLMSCQIAVKPKDYNILMTAIRHAYEWDYYPSLGNMWDLVPLSFVVDWFVDVSSIFEDIDRLVQSRYYDVLAVLNTIKASRDSSEFRGVELSYYDRSVDHRLSLGMSSVQLGLPSSINIVDGVSLLLM